MSGIALGIVLSAALLHAGWNFLLKKSDRKILFIWWFLLVNAILYFPMLLCFLPGISIPPLGWFCIVASGVIHAAYFACMGCAYQRGDLSLVYPLARGSGPLFVPFLAVVFLSEEIALLGGIGILFIIGGIYCIHLRSFSRAAFWEPFAALKGGASLWALFTGLAIAFYSLVDKVGVGQVTPPVYIYIMMLITWMLITPWVIRDREGLKSEWQSHKGAIAMVGFLSGFTYLMILFALTMSKVSYVAAVREVSIVASAYFGIAHLGEKHGRQKLLGALLICLGVTAIGLSR